MTTKNTAENFGARVYFLRDGTIQIKQTVLRGGQYRVDGHKEGFAKPGDGQPGRVFDLLESARRGELCVRGAKAKKSVD